MKNLKILRGKLSQTELAKILNLDQGTISNYESGKTEPTITILKNMSKFFNVSIDFLVDNINTSDIINKKFLSKNQKEALDLLLQADDEQCRQFIAYFIGLNTGKEYQLNQIMKIKNKYKK